jgi:hypothetical protein
VLLRQKRGKIPYNPTNTQTTVKSGKSKLSTPKKASKGGKGGKRVPEVVIKGKKQVIQESYNGE